MISIKCPSCGRTLTDADRYGRSLCCPACRCQFLYQNGTAVVPAERFAPSEITWHEMLDKCFEEVITNSDSSFANNIKVLERKEFYEPFVEIVDAEKKSLLVAVGGERGRSVDRIEDTAQFKGVDGSADPAISVDSPDYDLIGELNESVPYVSDSILYIPFKMISFTIDGMDFECVAYGKTVAFTGDRKKLTVRPASSGPPVPGWINFLVGLFAIAVVIGAWYKFCYTYWHFHGFYLVVYADGYKCFLPFLGTAVIALLGYSSAISCLADFIEKPDRDGLTAAQRQIKETLYKKFSR